ncbi:MAG: metallophosphoesterase [Oligoflexia bacterium]|nr:metallophosphoesterase [Oligoflexia bacterium]
MTIIFLNIKKICLFYLIFSSIILFSHAEEKSSCSDGHLVIGDLHGSIGGLIKSLREANLVDDNGDWIGKKDTCLVILGDMIDRGKHSIQTYAYIQKLRKEAKKGSKKGKVIPLLGNHELTILQNNIDLAIKNGACFWLENKRDRDECLLLKNVLNSSTIISLSESDQRYRDKLNEKFQIFRQQIQNDILEGDLFPIYTTSDGIVMTHAGVSNEIAKEYLINNNDDDYFENNKKIDSQKFNDWITRNFYKGFEEDDYSNSIFGHNGIFYFRSQENNANFLNDYCSDFSQFKGHDIQDELHQDYFPKSSSDLQKYICFMDIGQFVNKTKGSAYITSKGKVMLISLLDLSKERALEYSKIKKKILKKDEIKKFLSRPSIKIVSSPPPPYPPLPEKEDNNICKTTEVKEVIYDTGPLLDLSDLLNEMK